MIYLDDNRAGRFLAGLLRKDGHAVVCPGDVGLAGASDALHLEYAIRTGLTTLTADSTDFRELHQLVETSGGGHPGILVVRFDNDPKRDMKPRHIAVAVRKLERSGTSSVNQVVILNQWR